MLRARNARPQRINAHDMLYAGFFACLIMQIVKAARFFVPHLVQNAASDVRCARAKFLRVRVPEGAAQQAQSQTVQVHVYRAVHALEGRIAFLRAAHVSREAIRREIPEARLVFLARKRMGVTHLQAVVVSLMPFKHAAAVAFKILDDLADKRLVAPQQVITVQRPRRKIRVFLALGICRAYGKRTLRVHRIDKRAKRRLADVRALYPAHIHHRERSRERNKPGKFPARGRVRGLAHLMPAPLVKHFVLKIAACGTRETRAQYVYPVPPAARDIRVRAFEFRRVLKPAEVFFAVSVKQLVRAALIREQLLQPRIKRRFLALKPQRRRKQERALFARP